MINEITKKPIIKLPTNADSNGVEVPALEIEDFSSSLTALKSHLSEGKTDEDIIVELLELAKELEKNSFSSLKGTVEPMFNAFKSDNTRDNISLAESLLMNAAKKLSTDLIATLFMCTSGSLAACGALTVARVLGTKSLLPALNLRDMYISDALSPVTYSFAMISLQFTVCVLQNLDPKLNCLDFIKSSKVTGLTMFAGASMFEILQLMGKQAGVFDPIDFVAYGVGSYLTYKLHNTFVQPLFQKLVSMKDAHKKVVEYANEYNRN